MPLFRLQYLLLDILLEPFLGKEFMLSDPFTLQCFNRFIRKETDPFFLIWIDKYKVNYLLNQQLEAKNLYLILDESVEGTHGYCLLLLD